MNSSFISETAPYKAIVSKLVVSQFVIACQRAVHIERDIVLRVLSVCLSVRPSNASMYNDQIQQDNPYGELYFDGSSKSLVQGAGLSAP